MTEVLILSVMMSVCGTSYSNVGADTNKVDNSGKKIGFWKEKIGNSDYYGNYVKDRSLSVRLLIIRFPYKFLQSLQLLHRHLLQSI